MQTIVIDIHPLDFGAILSDKSEQLEDVIMWSTPLVEYKGKIYRQTVEAPVTSEYGKKIMAISKEARDISE